MAGTGPPPKHPSTRARSNAAPTAKLLPALGRGDVEPPAWPLRPDRDLERQRVEAEITTERLREQLNATEDGRTVKRLERELDRELARATWIEADIAGQAELESQLWTELWKTPQAVAWQEYGWVREVALYVRCTLRAEDGDLRAASEARQRSDRLGLSPLAMRRLQWEVDRAPAEPAPAAKPTRAGNGKPRKDPRVVLHAVS